MEWTVQSDNRHRANFFLFFANIKEVGLWVQLKRTPEANCFKKYPQINCTLYVYLYVCK